MDNNTYLTEKIKIVLIGDIRVGKTTLRKRYMGEGFQNEYAATLGADFSVKQFDNDTLVTIYDLAGDHQSTSFRQEYYLGAKGIIIVYDITNRESFENLPRWFKEIENSFHSKLRIVILGNKNDLWDQTDDPVQEYEGYEFATKMQNHYQSSISFLSCSALTGYNVEVAFSKLLAEIAYN